MTPTFYIEDRSDPDTCLQCPSCKNYWLHQERVEVFDREEDAKTGAHVVVANQRAVIDSDPVKGNPSKRRQGLLIQFSCEQCLAKPVLAIWQNKGVTLVDFVPTCWTEADFEAGICHRTNVGQPRPGLTIPTV